MQCGTLSTNEPLWDQRCAWKVDLRVVAVRSRIRDWDKNCLDAEWGFAVDWDEYRSGGMFYGA